MQWSVRTQSFNENYAFRYSSNTKRVEDKGQRWSVPSGVISTWYVVETIRMRISPTQWLEIFSRWTSALWLCFILVVHFWHHFNRPGRMEGLVGLGGNPNEGPGIKCTAWQPTPPPTAQPRSRSSSSKIWSSSKLKLSNKHFVVNQANVCSRTLSQ